MKTWLLRLIAIVLLVVLASACTPQELKAWYQSQGIDTSHMSDQDLANTADALTKYFDSLTALHRFDYAISDASLARLRGCESGGNYGAIGGGGAYRGAYQFSRSTWDAEARANFPAYQGIDPIYASPEIQDAFARGLFVEQGSSPWPLCGRLI